MNPVYSAPDTLSRAEKPIDVPSGGFIGILFAWAGYWHGRQYFCFSRAIALKQCIATPAFTKTAIMPPAVIPAAGTTSCSKQNSPENRTFPPCTPYGFRRNLSPALPCRKIFFTPL
ncbi:MAG: hypothetical protein PHW69_08390 [Elusimicrobiaceae bacterium]|nr:hypothetical protein [Elusimicrobiaceae bacterium]